MPVYEFMLVGGTEILERYFSASECPELGATIDHNGKRYMRVISTPPNIQPVWKPYASLSMPRRMPGFNHDAEGHTVIETQAQERRAMAILDRKRD
jgi:hypothetical protein